MSPQNNLGTSLIGIAMCHTEAHCAISLSGCLCLFKNATRVPAGPHLLIFQYACYITMGWITGCSKLMQKTSHCYCPCYCSLYFVPPRFAASAILKSFIMCVLPCPLSHTGGVWVRVRLGQVGLFCLYMLFCALFALIFLRVQSRLLLCKILWE